MLASGIQTAGGCCISSIYLDAKKSARRSDDWMRSIKIKFAVTLDLDEKWASNLSIDELTQYIKDRMNSSLGFRGQIKKFSVVSK